MKLSVVIPSFNEEKYLPATLASINKALNTWTSSEVIVVDNQHRCTPLSRGGRHSNPSANAISKGTNTALPPRMVSIFFMILYVVRPLFVRRSMQRPMLLFRRKRCVSTRRISRVGRWSKPALLAIIADPRRGLSVLRSTFFARWREDTTIFVGEDIEFHWRLDKLAKKRGGYTAFIEDPKVRTSSRRWDQMGLVRMLFFTHPATIFLAWRYRSFWKDWYDRAIR